MGYQFCAKTCLIGACGCLCLATLEILSTFAVFFYAKNCSVYGVLWLSEITPISAGFWSQGDLLMQILMGRISSCTCMGLLKHTAGRVIHLCSCRSFVCNHPVLRHSAATQDKSRQTPFPASIGIIFIQRLPLSLKVMSFQLGLCMQ